MTTPFVVRFGDALPFIEETESKVPADEEMVGVVSRIVVGDGILMSSIPLWVMAIGA